MSRRPTDRAIHVARGIAAALAAVAFLAGFALQAWLGQADSGVDTQTAGPESHAFTGAGSGRENVSNRLEPASVRTEQGVPAGFARSERGTVAAADAFVRTGQALLDMDPLAAEKAVRQMASAGTAEEQVTRVLDQLAEARLALANGSGPITFRQGAMAWRLDSYNPDRARVAIWHVGVLAREGTAPPQAGWATSTFELVWERDDWKIAQESVVPGPAPILDDSAAPATAAVLEAALDGFAAFGSGR
jgi:hypothetical protein